MEIMRTPIVRKKRNMILFHNKIVTRMEIESKIYKKSSKIKIEWRRCHDIIYSQIQPARDCSAPGGGVWIHSNSKGR